MRIPSTPNEAVLLPLVWLFTYAQKSLAQECSCGQEMHRQGTVRWAPVHNTQGIQ